MKLAGLRSALAPDELAAAVPPSHGRVLGVVAAAAPPPAPSPPPPPSTAPSASREGDGASTSTPTPPSPSLDAPPSLPPRSGACSSTPSFYYSFDLAWRWRRRCRAGTARGFFRLLAEVLPQRGERRHLPGDREAIASPPQTLPTSSAPGAPGSPRRSTSASRARVLPAAYISS
uniref:Uncharacterized protein n=1 Tax=Ananas comosus var. bracteatus TaxID=296719 RepID=A0A6V7NUY7_ANACO|nr:unnamed protein product [Ananas comosus var. bracteatus]